MLEEIALSVLIISVIVLALTSCTGHGKHLSGRHPAVNEPADKHPE